MKTALLTHDDCLAHVTPAGHPEQVARLQYVREALADLPLNAQDVPKASREQLMLAHPASYIDQIEATTPTEGRAQLDADTWMSPGSFDAALRAAGGAIRAVDLVMGDEISNAFCALRPPGHHAETAKPMGFCLFGNAALAAKHALEHHGLSRVAVVDFDVHHGNGTQDLLWNDDRALVITSQQMPLWPGTGEASEIGAHGNVLNLPLPPDSASAQMRSAWRDQAFPRLRSFRPELLIISAGFDAHQDDPLAQLNWQTEDFAWITSELCKIAQECCQGRVVSVLEGGYDLEALAVSARAHVQELIKAGQ